MRTTQQQWVHSFFVQSSKAAKLHQVHMQGSRSSRFKGFLPSINFLANSSLALCSFTSIPPRGFHEEAKAFRVTWISLACMRMAEAWPWNATLNASSRGRSSAAATATHSNVISPATLSSAAASQIPTARLASTTGVQHTDAMQVQIRAQVTFA